MADELVNNRIPDVLLFPAEKQSKPISLYALLGDLQNPLVLQIYGEWCPGCRAAAVELCNLSTEYPGVSFALVNSSGIGGCRKFAETLQLHKRPVLHFHQTNIPESIGLRFIPHTLIVKADGIVVRNYDYTGTTLAKEVRAVALSSGGGGATRRQRGRRKNVPGEEDEDEDVDENEDDLDEDDDEEEEDDVEDSSGRSGGEEFNEQQQKSEGEGEGEGRTPDPTPTPTPPADPPRSHSRSVHFRPQPAENNKNGQWGLSEIGK